MSAVAESYLTPPQVGKQLRVSPSKIVAWIRAAELRAVNVASSVRGRPRWRIAPEDLEAFLARRQFPPAPKVSRTRRRPRDTGVIQFF
jgi:excisionase family DNA binding protein